eukprot:224979_1
MNTMFTMTFDEQPRRTLRLIATATAAASDTSFGVEINFDQTLEPIHQPFDDSCLQWQQELTSWDNAPVHDDNPSDDFDFSETVTRVINPGDFADRNQNKEIPNESVRTSQSMINLLSVLLIIVIITLFYAIFKVGGVTDADVQNYIAVMKKEQAQEINREHLAKFSEDVSKLGNEVDAQKVAQIAMLKREVRSNMIAKYGTATQQKEAAKENPDMMKDLKDDLSPQMKQLKADIAYLKSATEKVQDAIKTIEAGMDKEARQTAWLSIGEYLGQLKNYCEKSLHEKPWNNLVDTSASTLVQNCIYGFTTLQFAVLPAWKALDAYLESGLMAGLTTGLEAAGSAQLETAALAGIKLVVAKAFEAFNERK